MIDPASVMTDTARRGQSSFPAKVRSETTVSYKPPDLSSMSEETDSEDEDENNDSNLSMSPVDVRVLRRIAARANVLPIVARADSLTDAKLAAVRKAIRRDLQAADIDFGVFGPVSDDPKSPDGQNGANGHKHANSISNASEVSAEPSTNGNGTSVGHGTPEPSEENTKIQEQEEPEQAQRERPSRPVIKLRPTRLARRPSRSRSRLEMSEMALAEDPNSLELVNDTESVASVRFSAHIIAKTDLSAQLPFALITPEHARRRHSKVLAASPSSVNGHGAAGEPASRRASTVVAPSEDGHGAVTSPVSPSTPASLRQYPYLQGPPADLRGVFVRRFRWGTVDVLNPEHCDFPAMRTAVMSTHIKVCLCLLRRVVAMWR